MALRGIGTGRRRRHLNADVNIINLVDVVLCVLILWSWCCCKILLFF